VGGWVREQEVAKKQKVRACAVKLFSPVKRCIKRREWTAVTNGLAYLPTITVTAVKMFMAKAAEGTKVF